VSECSPAISEAGVYPVSEDTLLLARFVERAGRVGVAVEVGCGSGLATLELARRSEYTVGVDISEQAALAAKSRVERLPNADVVVSDRLSALRERSADLVVSNPPYLPCDYCSEPLWCGGTSGVEFSAKLALQAAEVLKENGSFVVLASSLADVESLVELMREVLGEVAVEEEYRIGLFETLYILRARKIPLHSDDIPEKVLRGKGEGAEQDVRPPSL
jgi:release factor glutamine methyltransferase